MPSYTERAPGVYRAVFKGIVDKTITDRESGEEVDRWLWTWQETKDASTVGQLDTLTSPHFKSRSNGLKLFTGMLGRAPKEGDNTDQCIGQEYDVVYGPNQAGRFTVIAASRLVTDLPTGLPPIPPTTAATAATQHAIQEGDDLPF